MCVGRRTSLGRLAVGGWHSPEGLKEILKQDIDAANEKLQAEPIDALGLREYQETAIKAVEAAVAEGKDTCLVAMATGTGKTRTAIGLIYRLIKSGRVRRVLFLVDRSALGKQTGDALEEIQLENLQTFPEIYDLKLLEDIKVDTDTKLHIATVQGMVRRLLDPSDVSEAPTVDTYDCIVVDECHRGYGLDQELTDAEFKLAEYGIRTQADYISRYRRVLEHFDAVKIGLTATPAAHTTEIFGKPTYLYGYREAVIDGFLIDHEPPVSLITKLAEEGIRFEKGAQVRMFDPVLSQDKLAERSPRAVALRRAYFARGTSAIPNSVAGVRKQTPARDLPSTDRAPPRVERVRLAEEGDHLLGGERFRDQKPLELVASE